MKALVFPGILIASYLIGSIPFGLILVKLATGKDIRQVQSGRTGGTNAMRAGGVWVGVLTVVLDILKGASGVWLAKAVMPSSAWLAVLAPLAVILGHNYSLYLTERDEKGRIRLRGGAGGAPCVGGSVGLWFPSLFVLVPLGVLVFYFGGYASVTTMSMALSSSVLFAVLALVKGTPWEYVVYGLLAEVLLLWALRPNIRRLLRGEERMVGYRARKSKKDQSQGSSKYSSSSSSYSSS